MFRARFYGILEKVKVVVERITDVMLRISIIAGCLLFWYFIYLLVSMKHS